MAKLVRIAFERDGAFGLSTGLIYVPAKFSQTDEIVALAKVASEFGGFYHSHIRDEGEQVLTAVDELITIAREAKLTAVVTHIKMSNPKVWGKSGDVVRRIEAARAAGLSVWADQYPYEAGMTFLATNLLPGWAEADGIAATRARLADPATRARIRVEALKAIEGRGGPGSFLIGRYDADPSLQGKRLDEIARQRHAEPVDVGLSLIEHGEPHAMVFSMRDDDIVNFMRQPWTMTGSDGFGVAEPHPRSYGTFPRKLQVFALERKIISLEQAIRSMTGLPAEVLGLPDRGVLREGAIADVVVFDPAKLRATSTYESSRRLAEGMVDVYVNGQAAIADGKFTDARAGQVLSRRK
jgi:N-acyl-D-amino-acid deacylase